MNLIIFSLFTLVLGTIEIVIVTNDAFIGKLVPGLAPQDGGSILVDYFNISFSVTNFISAGYILILTWKLSNDKVPKPQAGGARRQSQGNRS